MVGQPYNPANWYWVVAGSTTQVYSSASDSFVLVTDPTYQAWLTKGGKPTKVDSLQTLSDVLSAAGQPLPPGGGASDSQKEALFADVPQAVKVWALDIDNRVRVLEGQPTRTANQFKTYVKGLL